MCPLNWDCAFACLDGRTERCLCMQKLVNSTKVVFIFIALLPFVSGPDYHQYVAPWRWSVSTQSRSTEINVTLVMSINYNGSILSRTNIGCKREFSDPKRSALVKPWNLFENKIWAMMESFPLPSPLLHLAPRRLPMRKCGPHLWFSTLVRMNLSVRYEVYLVT